MNQATDVLEDYSAGLEALANQALQESTSAHEYFESAIRRNDSVANAPRREAGRAAAGAQIIT